MKRIALTSVLFTLVLWSVLLITGCEDTVNPVSPKWRTWKLGDTVPGYVLSEPSGSRADVEAKARMWDNYWALELAVDLNTGNPNDNIFTVGEDVVIALYISDASDSIWNGQHLIHLVWREDWYYNQPPRDTVKVLDLRLLGSDISAPNIDGQGDDLVWQGPDWVETHLDNITGISGDNGLTEAYLLAVHDSSRIYFKLAWPDPTGTMSMDKDMWQFEDNLTWTREGQEDMVLFLFPTEQPPADWEILGGATFFPADHPTDGAVNVWRWHAGLTNPVGWADDLVATASGLEEDEGISGYSENYDPVKSYPPFVQNPSIEPSEGPEVLLASEAIAFEETIRP